MPGTTSQEQPHRQEQGREHDEQELVGHIGKSSAAPEAKDVDMDSVLDDISSALEENAEEYVSGFVQQGGQ